MPLLDVTLTVSTEERPDRWAAFVHELGFFAYGKTEEEASDRVERILSALAESFAGDVPGFNTYLDEHEVKYVRLDDPGTLREPNRFVAYYRDNVVPACYLGSSESATFAHLRRSRGARWSRRLAYQKWKCER